VIFTCCRSCVRCGCGVGSRCGCRHPVPIANVSVWGAGLGVRSLLYAVQSISARLSSSLSLNSCCWPTRVGPWCWLLDNAQYHKAKAVVTWLTEHTQVELVYLPAYTGHKRESRGEGLVAPQGLRRRQSFAWQHRFFSSAPSINFLLFHTRSGAATGRLAKLVRTFATLLS